MFSYLWNFIKRHRRKFIYTGVITGALYLLGRYARKKLRELQESEASASMEFSRRQHHFDSNQRTCNMTALSMVPAIKENLTKLFDTEILTTQLQSRPSNKVEIWEDLKIQSFSRTITALYSCCILVVELRVQLNILGGYMYLDNSGHQDAMPHEVVATAEVQEKYLASIQYFLNTGIEDLAAALKRAVQLVFDGVSLRHPVSLRELQNMLELVRSHIEYRTDSHGYHAAPSSSLCQYMLPPEDEVLSPQACTVDSDELMYQRMVRETRDMMDTSDFHSVLGTCLDTAFVRIVDQFATSYRPAEAHTDEQNMSASVPLTNPNDISLPMAKVIPIANGLIHNVCCEAPNPFVQELLLKKQVSDFAANVYEAFSQEPAAGQVL